MDGSRFFPFPFFFATFPIFPLGNVKALGVSMPPGCLLSPTLPDQTGGPLYCPFRRDNPRYPLLFSIQPREDSNFRESGPLGPPPPTFFLGLAP